MYCFTFSFLFLCSPFALKILFNGEPVVDGATGWLSSSEDGESIISPPEGLALAEEAESGDNVRIEAC